MGVGISRSVEPIITAIESLRKPDMARLIHQPVLEKALREADDLEPSLQLLNAGKGSQTDAGGANQAGFGRVRRERARQSQAQRHSEEEITQAARTFHTWLSKPTSPLRALLSYLSEGGTFYAANVAEKVARAWVEHKPATVHDAVAAAVTRASGSGAQVDPGLADDTQGLF